MSAQTGMMPVEARRTRDRVVAALSEHFARDNLDMDEFERRLTVAHGTDSVPDLEALLQDLPSLPAEQVQARAAAAEAMMVPEKDVKPRQRLLAIMGGASRRGTWKVPRRLEIVAFMGGGQLDFREARLPRGVVEIHVTAVMGGLEIVVPPHLAVEIEGSAIMGGFDHVDRSPPAPDPEATLLRITGFALMGGVAVSTRLPGNERKQLPGGRKDGQRRIG